VADIEARLRSLLSLNQAIVGHIHLHSVLREIVESAVDLVGARYGAIGVLGADGAIVDFVHVGIDEKTAARMGHPPRGRGLLGAIVSESVRVDHVAADPRFTGFPSHHPHMDSFVGVPIRVREEMFGNLYLAEHPDGHFTEEDTELLRSLAVTAGIAIEKARLYEAARLRERWAAATAEVRAAFLEVDDERPYRMLADQLPMLTGAALVAIVTSTERGTVRLQIVRGDAMARQLESVELPGHDRVARALLATGATVLPEVALPTFEGETVRFGDAFVVSLGGQDGADVGVLLARHLRQRPFSDDDIRRTTALASVADLAGELSRARADRHRLALLEDRGRIARDLHDNVIQRLFAAGMQLQVVSAGVDDPRVGDRLSAQIDALDEAIAEIRTAIFALQHDDVGGVTLRDRIVDVVGEYRALLAEPPRLVFRGPVDHDVPADLAPEAAAVVREALSNVVRHARASRAEVRVEVRDGRIVIEVGDDGRGLDPARERRSGLSNLQARAEARGGTFSLAPRPGGGTLAAWSVPLSAPAAASDDDTSRQEADT
jgi:signal transduction histidine kinase